MTYSARQRDDEVLLRVPTRALCRSRVVCRSRIYTACRFVLATGSLDLSGLIVVFVVVIKWLRRGHNYYYFCVFCTIVARGIDHKFSPKKRIQQLM